MSEEFKSRHCDMKKLAEMLMEKIKPTLTEPTETEIKGWGSDLTYDSHWELRFKRGQDGVDYNAPYYTLYLRRNYGGRVSVRGYGYRKGTPCFSKADSLEHLFERLWTSMQEIGYDVDGMLKQNHENILLNIASRKCSAFIQEIAKKQGLSVYLANGQIRIHTPELAELFKGYMGFYSYATIEWEPAENDAGFIINKIEMTENIEVPDIRTMTALHDALVNIGNLRVKAEGLVNAIPTAEGGE